ncbi:VAMP7a [Gracilaria domingensis]|nr:VAMP7a [Gracilaria domingensis]
MFGGAQQGIDLCCSNLCAETLVKLVADVGEESESGRLLVLTGAYDEIETHWAGVVVNASKVSICYFETRILANAAGNQDLFELVVQKFGRKLAEGGGVVESNGNARRATATKRTLGRSSCAGGSATQLRRKWGKGFDVPLRRVDKLSRKVVKGACRGVLNGSSKTRVRLVGAGEGGRLRCGDAKRARRSVKEGGRYEQQRTQRKKQKRESKQQVRVQREEPWQKDLKCEFTR